MRSSCLRAASSSSGGSTATPASSAAKCGDTAGPKRYGATSSGDCPVTWASSSWSRGQTGSGGSSSPVTAGLKAATAWPREAKSAHAAAASTVLPTPVSVPATNRPRNQAVPLSGVGQVVENAGLARRFDLLGRRGGAPRRLGHGPREGPRRVAQLRGRVRGASREGQAGGFPPGPAPAGG